MLRSFLIYLSKAIWAQKLVTSWSFAWWAASRFVAGENMEDAIPVIRELNEKGINATLDHLGEHTSTAEEADKATDDILLILNEIDKAGIKANVSIKLTQIGMGLNEEICRHNLGRILEQVKAHGNFLRIDMEDTPYTDITISLYHSMLEQGYDANQVGLVIQAYLFRSEEDIRKLLKRALASDLSKALIWSRLKRHIPKRRTRTRTTTCSPRLCLMPHTNLSRIRSISISVFRPYPPSHRTMTSASHLRNNMPKRSGLPEHPSSSKCSTASDATCRSNS